MLGRQIAIGFGIAIISPLLIYYGVATLYPPPKLPVYPATVGVAPGSNANPEEPQQF